MKFKNNSTTQKDPKEERFIKSQKKMRAHLV
jgi:hypothetical protein